MRVDILREEANGVVVVTPNFETLDAVSSPAFAKNLIGSLKPGQRVLLDLNKIDYADSSGCGAIISLVRHLRTGPGGDLKLCALRQRVRTVFQLVRLHKICDVFNTRQEALTGYQGGTATPA